MFIMHIPLDWIVSCHVTDQNKRLKGLDSLPVHTRGFAPGARSGVSLHD